MNDASNRRIALARQVLAPYVQNPNLRAVVLGGSVG